ncbi:MAG: N-acetylmuramoyl-L-alanine amidase [Alicyclobacillus macrosporangiidus]|uniref:N-acetylmuramoyl-L-alanine amidase n=1 Tax=Alicyclobacillus macrosporangiidus TaxID=392015 RepID=UPI0026EFFC58|nr:N-acetylmuramoyl-L-alanine amidase [Alicyclobacillus macrosporangiidus]MCL6597469.1 N-acetylmuramoyl-L-alanine amidase [Alicyclobacillus macrosporangiidus]
MGGRRTGLRAKCQLAAAMCALAVWALPCGSGGIAYAAEPGLVGRTIVIDAGHGGPDGGAKGVNGEVEKTVTLAVALKVAELLREAGADVHLTRTSDDDLASDEDTAQRRRHQSDLRNRTRFVQSHNPDAFVSIHCNSAPSPAWRGAQTIYMDGNPEGERLAKIMQDHFRQQLLPTKREAEDMSTLYLLKRIDGPAVLAEIGFLSNPDEAYHLVQNGYQEAVALAIYTALLEYFGTPPDDPS